VELQAAGFGAPESFDCVEARSTAATAAAPAIAYCQGTPLRNEIEQRDASRLAQATSAAADVVRERFGERDVYGLIRGFVVTARCC
jgi:hypothetical protein